MNDSISILLATTILALGGLGLYMYKSSESEEYNEESMFGGNFWGLSDNKDGDDENLDENFDEYLEEVDDYKPRRRNGKTQRNRKSAGSSKRRY